ncbi:hypothetical protein A5320_04025 [Rheinheimera sp. SA_1]|uniref:hypothetical protein n=1 Tax=Rheinheimera sp. SA_1 TaxID=1827365 RepID=UPI0007FED322|nr:hypothetical protein [Rheinheimera sp. SA_1]OBP16572.1 hypothetical protein A5320_04025 [Rheinheimera sp. SA_1]
MGGFIDRYCGHTQPFGYKDQVAAAAGLFYNLLAALVFIGLSALVGELMNSASATNRAPQRSLSIP